MNTSEVLNKAADLIEERGWTTGCEGMMAPGPYCVQGAMGAALGLEVSKRDFVKYEVFDNLAIQCTDAYAAVREFVDFDREYLWQWNDRLTSIRGENLSRAEAQARVIATLRAAALIEAAKENAAAEVRESVTVR